MRVGVRLRAAACALGPWLVLVSPWVGSVEHAGSIAILCFARPWPLAAHGGVAGGLIKKAKTGSQGFKFEDGKLVAGTLGWGRFGACWRGSTLLRS